MQKLSLIITTRNRINDLQICLKTILKSSFKDFELIIVDDNSSDETKQLKRGDVNFKNLKIIHTLRQLMMVGARNLGAKMAKGDYILFVDDDNIFTKEAIFELMKCAKDNPKYLIIGTPIYCYSTKTKNEAAEKMNLFTGAAKGINNDTDLLVDTDSTPNVFLVKKEIFEKLGYFDQLLVQTYSEADLVLRAKKAGFKAGTCQRVIIYHNITEEGSIFKRALGFVFPQKAYCLIRNRMVMVKRYGNFWQKAVFLVFFSWVWPLLYSFGAIRHKKTGLIKLYFRGFYDGLIYFLKGNLNNSLPKLLK